jgi:hypothetical protein
MPILRKGYLDKGGKMGRKRLVAGVTFLFFVFSLFLATVARAEIGTIGSKVRLVSKNGASIPVAINEKAYKELWEAIGSGDDDGLFDLIVIRGEVFMVENRTKVLILAGGWVRNKVRVLEGKHKGKSGWVPVGVKLEG